MKVFALATDAFGGYGGIARYNRDLVAALAARDDAVTVLPRLAPEPEPTPSGVRQLAPRHGKVRYAATAAALVLRQRPDAIINAHIYHSPLSAALKRVSGAKMISVLHGTEIWTELPERLLKPLAASDVVLCVSHDTEARILAQCPQLQGRTAVTFNTVGDAFTPGGPEARAAAREKFDLGEAFVVLTVARLDTRKGADGRFYKGHDRIIPLLADPPVDGPVLYLVAGIGDDRARLERVAQDAGVADRVRFLGKVADGDLPDLYRAADLFALPSTGEGFGIVYLEAMASGVPAIGLSIGGVPDALSVHPLGTAVAADAFAVAFKDAARAAMGLAAATRGALSAAVHNTFGQAAFRARVDQAIKRLD